MKGFPSPFSPRDRPLEKGKERAFAQKERSKAYLFNNLGFYPCLILLLIGWLQRLSKRIIKICEIQIRKKIISDHLLLDYHITIQNSRKLFQR
ncbi:hypothetical protein IM40_01585 [Candidatus Paracaedimonas acanthamoebae]|nr:hypothetical protein IM40_01585 [Candidatus Paracaedimonas acanthamoebae]